MNPTENQPGSVLVVDDNPNNLSVLCGMLENAGYTVRPAISGMLALRAVETTLPDVILLDIRMPEMDGYEVCKKLRADEHTRDIPIIFISALQETEDKVRAFSEGGTDYVVKPFHMEEVLARVRTQIELRRSREGLKRAYAEMEARAEERSLELLAVREEQFRITAMLKNSLSQTIEAIALALEKRDPYTAGHQRGVTEIAIGIATRLGMDPNALEGIRLGSMIHDIGKIYVPAEILNRPGRLSETEFSLIKTHCDIGYEIIQGIEFPWPVAEIVRQHHERQDGSGYPRGLKGGDILMEARIIAVADVIEAMSAHRPYRPALGLEAAIAEITKKKGALYDPDVVDAALAMHAEGQLAFLAEPHRPRHE